MNEALRDWVTNVADTFYCIGTAAGPHPYPAMVRDFQSVIGDETRAQMHGAPKAACPTRSSPASAAAPTPSACSTRSSTTRASRSTASRRPATASTAATATRASLDRRPPRRAARQPHLPAAGRGRPDQRRPFDLGRPRLSRHRPRARLAARHRPRRVSSRPPTRRRWTPSSSAAKLEGIIPALEPAHAHRQGARTRAARCRKDHLIVMNLCGRGDKDIFTVADASRRYERC